MSQQICAMGIESSEEKVLMVSAVLEMFNSKNASSDQVHTP